MNDDWKPQAACRGKSPAIFFPPKGDTGARGEALTICRDCPVREECLQAGVGETGIWGGTSERKRRALRSQQLQACCPDCGVPTTPLGAMCARCSHERHLESNRRSRRRVS